MSWNTITKKKKPHINLYCIETEGKAYLTTSA